MQASAWRGWGRTRCSRGGGGAGQAYRSEGSMGIPRVSLTKGSSSPQPLVGGGAGGARARGPE